MKNERRKAFSTELIDFAILCLTTETEIDAYRKVRQKIQDEFQTQQLIRSAKQKMSRLKVEDKPLLIKGALPKRLSILLGIKTRAEAHADSRKNMRNWPPVEA